MQIRDKQTRRPGLRWLRRPDRWKIALATSAGALALASTAVLSVPAGAFGPHGRHGRDFARWRVERLLEGVGASEQQRERVEEILAGAFEALRDARPDRAEVHEAFAQAIGGEQVDRDALEALRARHVARMEARSRELVAAIAEAAEVLDAEQRAVLVQQMQEMHEHHGHHGSWH